MDHSWRCARVEFVIDYFARRHFFEFQGALSMTLTMTQLIHELCEAFLELYGRL